MFDLKPRLITEDAGKISLAGSKSNHGCVPGVGGFCGVVYPLLEAVDDDDEDEEWEDEEEDASEERDIGLRRLIWSTEQQSPLVEAALEPGLLPVGVDTVEVAGETAIEATGM